MQKKERSRIKRIGVDVLGVLLIIAAGLSAPIPGPGGLPLLILGLSLLATNHTWAENLLNRVKDSGSKLGDMLFNGNKYQKWVIDILGIAVIAGAVWLATQFTKSTAKTAAISLTLLALVLLFGNRNRYKNLKAKVKKPKP